MVRILLILNEVNFATSLQMGTNVQRPSIRMNPQPWLQNSDKEIRFIRVIRSFISDFTISFPLFGNKLQAVCNTSPP